MSEPELTPEQAKAVTNALGGLRAPSPHQHSVNERAERLMGRRLTPEQEAQGVIAFDQPAELGFWCPVCRVEPLVDGDYDERLHWSEYAGFLWCDICDRDYPSALCVPFHLRHDPVHPWVHAGPLAAVKVFLDSVEQAVAPPPVVPATHAHLVAACRSLRDDLRDGRDPSETDLHIFAALDAIDAAKDPA